MDLDIAAKTLGDRTATVAVLGCGGYRKALAAVGPGRTAAAAFSEAVARLTRPSVVVLRSNRSDRKLRDAVLAENAKGVHTVFFSGAQDLGKLEILAYEIALQNGTDPVTMQEAVDG